MDTRRSFVTTLLAGFGLLALGLGIPSTAEASDRLPRDRIGLAAWVAPGALTDLARAGAFCSATAKAARTACALDVQGDYWLATGVCINVADDDAREECEDDAADELAEERDACREQYEARLELCDRLGEERYDPDFDPANFVDPDEIGESVAPNPFFPLVVGNEWVYESEDETTTVTVLDKTKLIDGVTCRVVLDVVEVDGFPVEITDDWFAQDLDGNVWYCGESSREFEVFPGDDPQEAELTSIDGSFKAGRDGAEPGVLILANPAVGVVYREEAALGVAEDAAEVVSLTGSASVPAASCDGDCMVTRNFQPLEPGAEEHKYYLPGVGLILEVASEGDRTELVSFSAR